jgi:sterol desaturase/sphingolipid hydroxylase (fatty acid hydroxylase superfamily)
MIVEPLFFLGGLYVNFITSYQNALVLAFVFAFTVLAFFLGLNRAVLSRPAVMNSLATFALLALNIALVPLIFVASKAILAAYQSLGIPSIPESYWKNWHWLPVAMLAFVVRDFADYWSHRAMHTKLGWPIHAVHHSDTHVNGFTTFRVHVLEVLMMKAFHISFMGWLGIPAETVAALHVFASLHNAYVHFEVDIDHGPLNWLIASPRYHRWHHADFKPAYGKNLANVIPAWDMLFGTYYRAEACNEKMGAQSEGISGTDPAKLMLLPFLLWSRMAQGAIAKRPGAKGSHAPGTLLEPHHETKK